MRLGGVTAGPFRKSRGWEKRGVNIAMGYEGRGIDKPPGLKYGIKRGSKTTARKKRSRPAFGGYVPYVVRPGRW